MALMALFEKILVPVDLTEKNRRAVEVAGELASASGGSVTLLHVIELLDLPFEEVEDFYRQIEERAAEAMASLASPLESAGVSHAGHVRYGARAEEIVAFASEEGFDLILLSSHRADLDEPAKNWASLSHKVAILAQTPVLLVK